MVRPGARRNRNIRNILLPFSFNSPWLHAVKFSFSPSPMHPSLLRRESQSQFCKIQTVPHCSWKIKSGSQDISPGNVPRIENWARKHLPRSRDKTFLVLISILFSWHTQWNLFCCEQNQEPQPLLLVQAMKDLLRKRALLSSLGSLAVKPGCAYKWNLIHWDCTEHRRLADFN